MGLFIATGAAQQLKLWCSTKGAYRFADRRWWRAHSGRKQMDNLFRSKRLTESAELRKSMAIDRMNCLARLALYLTGHPPHQIRHWKQSYRWRPSCIASWRVSASHPIMLSEAVGQNCLRDTLDFVMRPNSCSDMVLEHSVLKLPMIVE